MGSMSSIPYQPQQQDSVQGYTRLMELKRTMQEQAVRQQILQGQAQSGQLANRQKEAELASQQGIVRTIKDASGDPSKVTLDTLVGNGVLPDHADSYLKAQLSQRQSLAALDSNTRSTLQAVDEQAAALAQTVRNIPGDSPQGQARRQNAYQQSMQALHGFIDSQQGLDPTMKTNMLSKFDNMPPTVPGNDDLDTFIAMHNHGATVTKQVNEQLSAQAEQFKNTQQGRDAAANAVKAGVETQGLQAGLPFVAPQKAAELSKTRAETQKALTETQNLGQAPIFAVDPNTNQRVMTTRPEAQAKGFTNLVPVKEGDVSKETDASAMISDVQLNKSRYLRSMQKVYSEPMTMAQKSALVALTPEKLGMDLGSLLKLELPDLVQKVSNASAFSVLTPDQKEAVVGYYSTLASVPAAQKALTNIGRSNKEMMDLELRTIPTPIMDAGTFNTMLNRFQGNIDQTAHKTVRIPGMPSASDVRNQIEGPQQQPSAPRVNFEIPRPY